MSGARPQSWLDDGASKMFIPAALSQSKPRVIRLSVTKSQRLARVECSACVSSFKSGNWLERRQQAKCLPSKMAGGNRLHKIVFYTSTITLTIAGGWGGVADSIIMALLLHFISFFPMVLGLEPRTLSTQSKCSPRSSTLGPSCPV